MPAPTRTWPQRAAVLTGLLLLIVFTMQACRKALREHGCDLTCYLDAGNLALAGQSPDVTTAYFEFPYPPLCALGMAPLAILPVVVATVIWSLLSAFALVYTVRSIRQITTNRRDAVLDARELVVLAGFAAIAFRIVHANFANGQINLTLVAMAMAFVMAMRAGRDRTAGFWLALAVHTKALPIVLLGMLLVRARHRAILWTAVFGITMTLLPVISWGTDLVQIYRDWFLMIEHKLTTSTVDMGTFTTDAEGTREYFTLRGMLATLWPATSPSAVTKYACVATVLGGTLWCDRKLHLRRLPHAMLAAFALWLLAALLIAPMSEKHHLAMMLPAAAFGLYAAIDGARRQRIEAFVWASVLALAIMLSKPFPQGPFYFLAVLTAYAWVLRTAWSQAPASNSSN